MIAFQTDGLDSNMWERWIRRSLLAMTGILVSFLLYLLGTKVETGPSSNASSQAVLGKSDAGIDQFRFTQARAGKVQWEVHAQRARVFETEKRAVLEAVEVTLYGAKGWEMKLTGEEGTVNLATKDFVLANRVDPIVVQFEGGYTVVSNHLTWTDERRTIATKDPVTISGHGLKVSGRGFKGFLDAEEFQVLENVRVDLVR
ncbi:MAG: LPS export ABC transporter periplasmic protein LptC [Nitrospirae bacterium]|nr:MAG: LPS export ABC transporter periplasmic protein LptC [Nitrospirota bacterium]